jgi:hypothetical protein
VASVVSECVLHQRNLGTSIAGPSTGQAEIAAAFDHLAGQVTHLALRIKLTAAIAHAAKTEQAAEALRVATECREPRSQQKAVSCDGGEPIDSQNSIVSTSAAEDLGIARVGQAPTELANVTPETKTCSGESAIATGILNLHERLGSFIKS